MSLPPLDESNDLWVGKSCDALAVDGDNAVARIESGLVGGSPLLHLLYEDRIHGFQVAQLLALTLLGWKAQRYKFEIERFVAFPVKFGKRCIWNWKICCFTNDVQQDLYISEYVLVTQYDDKDLAWVNIGSDNGLLPANTKPLPAPMLTYHQWGSEQSVAFTSRGYF